MNISVKYCAHKINYMDLTSKLNPNPTNKLKSYPEKQAVRPISPYPI